MKQYSKKAMPQERTIATYIGAEVNFRWPYHAAVIKQLETRRSRTAAMTRGSRGEKCVLDRHEDRASARRWSGRRAALDQARS
jgi:hypothetical protein